MAWYDENNALCSGGTAIESGHYTTYGCANAFNGNIEDVWASQSFQNVALAHWVGYQFARAYRLKEIKYMVKYINEGSSHLTSNSALTLQGSNDGTSWTTVKAHTGLSTTDRDIVTLTVDNEVAYNRYRLANTNANSGMYMGFREVEMFPIVEDNYIIET